MGTTIPSLVCPSAPVRDLTITNPDDGSTFKAGTSDYVVLVSIEPTLFTTGVLPLGQNGDGMFSWYRLSDHPPETFKTRLEDVTDGLSNTLMLSEDAGRPWDYKGKVRQPVDQSTTPPRGRGVWAASTASVSLQIIGHSFDGLVAPGPCAVNCNNDRGVYSFHSGVANVCLGDGSVRSLNEQLDIFVLYALATTKAGEVISGDDY